MTVDESHCHDNSSIESVSTISTFIDEIALQENFSKKEKKINKNSANRKMPAIWTPRDIASLVRLLKEYGSDFTMISTKMDKTRDQIKRKFKVLEKQCPYLTDAIFEMHPTSPAPSNIDMEIEGNDFFDE
jgi:GTP-binding protein EngB required for normal cell division